MNGKRWLPKHTDALKRMARAGYTNAEIARHTGHCEETVRRQRRDRQIDPSHRTTWWKRWRRVDMVMA